MKLMGILNVTPDSFSDGGAFADPVARLHALLEQGADIVDIGAESTRPGAVLLSPEEEWARLEPVLLRIPAGAVVSVDTRHAETARRALALGVSIINDVDGLRDEAMLAEMARQTCPVVVMHALSMPADPAVHLPEDGDVVAEILSWKATVTARAMAAGIAPARLIYDPGLGFGKTPEQSLALVERAGEMVASGGDWLYGHSRKSFLRLFTDASPADRDALTIAFSKKLADAGVQFLRVHDVAGHRACM